MVFRAIIKILNLQILCGVLPVVLAVYTCLGVLPAGAAVAQKTVNLSDLNGHWASSHITRITALDMVKGYPDGTYKPGQEISRLEALALLLRAGGFGADAERLSSGKSVTAKKTSSSAGSGASSSAAPQVPWGQQYVDLAVEKGFLSFGSGEDYDYSGPISRLEAARLVAHIIYLLPPVFDSTSELAEKDSFSGDGFAVDKFFSDETLVQTDDRSYIRAVSAAGVMSGYPDGSFRPFNTLSRAEIAVILSRLVDQGWVKTSSGRIFTGWISSIDTQKGHSELELTSYGTVQKLKIAQNVTCYMGNRALTVEQAAGCRGEVILNAGRQVSWVNIIEQRDNIQNVEKIRGSVKLVITGRENFVIISDLHCEDRVLKLAWDSAVYGKKAVQSFATLKPGTFVDLETTNDQVRKATVLDVKTITGQVDRLDSGRLYLKGGLTGNKPGWFNNYDFARTVNKDGVEIGGILVGDKVQVTYMDPYPDEIDDELPLEIKVQ